MAFFISSVQRQEQNRLSQLDYVKNERLDIVNIDLQGNETHWETIKVFVRNPSIYDSAIYRIAFNDFYAKEWKDEYADKTYGIDTPPLPVMQGETKEISVDLINGMIGSGSLSRYDKLKVTIMTPSGNFFTRLFSPPVASVLIRTETYKCGIGERDVLVLDGSNSFGNPFVQNYSWLIDVPFDYLTVNWKDPNSYVRKKVNGSVVKYVPESLFDMDELSLLNITGPIRVTLTVSDSYGLLANSSTTIITRNSRIVPPSYFIFGEPSSSGDRTTIAMSLFDIYGRPVNNTLINFILIDSKNVTAIAPPFTKTVSGSASLTIIWLQNSVGGYAIIEVRADQLNPERILITKP